MPRDDGSVLVRLSPEELDRVRFSVGEVVRTWADGPGARTLADYRRLHAGLAFADESNLATRGAGSLIVVLVSTARAAEALQVSEQTVTTRCRGGELRAHRIGRGWAVEIPACLLGPGRAAAGHLGGSTGGGPRATEVGS